MSGRALFASLVLAAVAAGQGPEIAKFTVDGEVTFTALDPKDYGSMLGFSNGQLTIFPVVWEKTIALLPFPAHKKAVTAGAFTPDGDRAVTSSLDGTLKVWDAGVCKQYVLDKNAGKTPPIPTPKMTIQAHPGGATAVAVSPDGDHFLSGGTEGTLKVWDAKTGKLIHAIVAAHAGAVKGLVYRPKADEFVSAGADKLVKTWDSGKWTPGKKSDPLKTPINGIAVSPDGAQVAVASGVATKKDKGGLIPVLDAATLKESFVLKGHEDVVTCVVFHPSTAHLATGGADKMILVWDLTTKEKVKETDNAEPIRGLAITPAAGRFAMVSATRVRWFKGFGAKE